MTHHRGTEDTEKGRGKAARRLGLGLLSVPLCLCGETPTAGPDECLLAAIAMVETGWTELDKPCRRIGKKGERSAWQLTATTWRKHTPAPFTRASTDADLAAAVACMHLTWLKRELQQRGLHVTPYYLALGWNGGPGMWRVTVPARVQDYARRVCAIELEMAREAARPEICIVPGHAPGKVWLQHRDGEGGEFPAREVAAVMEQAAMLRGYFWAKL